MAQEKDLFRSVNRLQKKQRRIVVVAAILAFLLGVIAGSIWTYQNMDRVAIPPVAPVVDA